MPLATQVSQFIDDDIYYPEMDGKPMADSDFQRKPLTYLIEALDYAFREQPNVYVSGDLLIYYEQGNPKASVAPDVFVIFDVPKQERRIYQTWVEGKTPDVIIEIASPSTFKKDQIEKAKLYQQLGVQEYFQYDPTGDYLPQALQGHQLDNQGHYQKMITESLPDGTLVVKSRLLELELRLENGHFLRLFAPKSQEYLSTYAEEVDARRLAEKQILLERKRKEWALQEVQQERKKAEQEQQQKEQALQQLEQERQQKELAQQKVAKLAEQLQTLGLNPNDFL